MTRAAPIRLDLEHPGAPLRRTGVALLLTGVLLAAGLGYAFQAAVQERGALDDQLTGLTAKRGPVKLGEDKTGEEVAAMRRELDTPWTRLLAELEDASVDTHEDVALLQLEPDAAKHLVRITAEVRSLNDGLTLLKRLQQSSVLRHPVLESHERRKDDPEHPVRIKLVAEWH